jgi:FMN-dependent NADH-azoreductase
MVNIEIYFLLANPKDEVIHLDLYSIDIPMIDADVFSGWGKLLKKRHFLLKNRQR